MMLKTENKELLLNNNYLKICYNIIKQEKRPLRAKEIVEIALKSGMMPYHLYGKTQQKTIHARISEHIKKHQENSLFFRVSPGYFYITNLNEKDHFSLFEKVFLKKEKEKEKELIINSKEIKNLFYNDCVNFNPDENNRNIKYHAFSMVMFLHEDWILYDSRSVPNILISKISEDQLDLIDGHITNALQAAHSEVKKIMKINIEYDKFSFIGLLKRKIKHKNRIFFLFSCDVSSYISNIICHYNKNLKTSELRTNEIVDKIKKPLFLKNILEQII
ncbi:winged helix-turn-helix domain-containing protein [Acetobacter orientalis]|uniref:winged helix-turn-helix domain-containing protein n=1 Tax=Acetobacter orientalis TaxID=146474 RepID=UPI0039E90103